MAVIVADNQNRETGRRVNILLTSPRVTSAFRDVLFEAAEAAGMTPGEYALKAAAEKLVADGRAFSGVFHAGDIDHHNDNERAPARRTA